MRRRIVLPWLVVILLGCGCHAADIIEGGNVTCTYSTSTGANISWSTNDTHVYFEVVFPSAGWFGVGISPNGDMASADIMVGWVGSEDGLQMSDRFATQQSTPGLDTSMSPAGVDNILAAVGWYVDGVTTMQWYRLLNTGDPWDHAITDDTLTLIWASNDVDVSHLPQPFLLHDARGAFTVNLVNGTDGPPKTIVPPEPSAGLKAHGILMILAWSLLSSAGIYVARYLKNLLGVWWFTVHVVIQGTALACAVAAVTIVFVVKGVFTATIHSVLGLTIMGFAVLTTISGAISDRRWVLGRRPSLIDKAHWITGALPYLLAIVNVVLGFREMGLALLTPSSLFLSISVISLFAFFLTEMKLGQQMSMFGRQGETVSLTQRSELSRRGAIGERTVNPRYYIGAWLVMFCLFIALAARISTVF